MIPLTDKGYSLSAETREKELRALEAGLVQAAKRWPDLTATQRQSETGFCTHLFKQFAGRISFRIEHDGIRLFRVTRGDMFSVQMPEEIALGIGRNRALADMIHWFGHSIQCSSCLLGDEIDDFLLSVYLNRMRLADIDLRACLTDGTTMTFTTPTDIERPSRRITAIVLQWPGGQYATARFPGHSLANRAAKAFGGATPTITGRG